MNWDDVRLFLALARHGSARGAAALLGLSHTTVARRAGQLESRLGARLFDRDVSGYRLTGAGETMMSSAVQAEEALLAAERRLQGRDDQLSGEIRLTTADIIATRLIMPDLVTFARRYPEIDLHVLMSYDVFDLGRREADIAIRFLRPGQLPPEDLVGRKLATGMSCYYASRDYLGEHDPWQTGSSARWIGWDESKRQPPWVRSSPFPDVPAYGRLGNALLQAEAARSGLGLTVLPCFVGDTTEGLQRIPGCRPFENFEIWLLSHPDLRDAARLRTFRRFIADAFAERRPLLTGELRTRSATAAG
ncbi:MAG: LysR family transcriptional regulator [Woeseiaceae bacterium]